MGMTSLVPIGDYGGPFDVVVEPSIRRFWPMPSDWTLLIEAEGVVYEAAANLVNMQGARLRTERKELRDIVTEADLASEAIVFEACGRSRRTRASSPRKPARPGGQRRTLDHRSARRHRRTERGLPWFSVTVAYDVDGEAQLGLINAPKAGLTARYLCGRRRNDRWRARERLHDPVARRRGGLRGADFAFLARRGAPDRGAWSSDSAT